MAATCVCLVSLLLAAFHSSTATARDSATSLVCAKLTHNASVVHDNIGMTGQRSLGRAGVRIALESFSVGDKCAGSFIAADLSDWVVRIRDDIVFENAVKLFNNVKRGIVLDVLEPFLIVKHTGIVLEAAMISAAARFESLELSLPLELGETASENHRDVKRAKLLKGNNKNSGAKEAVVDALGAAGTKFDEFVKQLSGDLPFTLDNDRGTHYTPTRYTYAATKNELASEYIAQHMRGAAGLYTEFQTFRVGSTVSRNVIAYKNGTVFPDEVVVVGAHYDSTSQDPNRLAPGAVDDGSGTAAVMLFAEVMRTIKTQRTVVFALFSGEEQGLYGSKAFVESGLPHNFQIQNALLFDMISYSNKFFGVIVEGTPQFTELMDAVAFNVQNFGPRSVEERNRLTVRVSDQSFGSDHVSFQRAGIPAILGIEADDTDYPDYHRTTDTFANVNTDQSIVIARRFAAALCDLAICTM